VKGDDGAEKTIKVASIDATFLVKMFAEEWFCKNVVVW